MAEPRLCRHPCRELSLFQRPWGQRGRRPGWTEGEAVGEDEGPDLRVLRGPSRTQRGVRVWGEDKAGREDRGP